MVSNMSRDRFCRSPIKVESGVATLVTAVVLMLAVFGISFYLSEVVIKEKQSVSVKQRGFEAFNSAMAGLDLGINLVRLGTVDGGSTFTSSATMSFGSFDLTIPPVADDIYTVRVTGYSADLSVSRTISKSIAKLPSSTSPPNVPVVAKGAVDIGGNATVTNNLEDLTVWSGGGFDESGGSSSFETYINVDGTNDVISTTGTTRGPDIVSNDKNLSYDEDPTDDIDPMMQAFFDVDNVAELGASGRTKSEIDSTEGGLSKSLSGVIYIPNDETLNAADFNAKQTLDAADYDQYNSDSGCPDTGGSYQTNCSLIDGFSTTAAYILGTPDNPVVVAADAILELNANIVVFGILVADDGIGKLNGGVSIFGGVISLADSDLTGGPQIYLDKTIISKTPISSDFGPIRSRWKDW